MAVETPYRIEPCLLSTIPTSLSDIIAELVSASTTLGARLHSTSAASLAELVRVMNCYYSNLIEGHDTRPRDIERALKGDLDGNERRRDLQLEAKAHIKVQRHVDALHVQGLLTEPTSHDHVRMLHRMFYEDAPSSLLRIEHHSGAYEMEPGEFRSESKQDNAVGRHQPPTSQYVADFMAYFEKTYRVSSMRQATRIIAMAASHHRFNYIHPFCDGNGRVSRLMSHGMALCAGIGAHGLWSISRGLARGLKDRSEYKSMMDEADSPRRSSLDGRGNLSEEALLSFVTWFCEVALDQVRFMSGQFDLENLKRRLSIYVTDELGLHEDAAALAHEVLRVGELARGDASRVVGRAERSARGLLSELIEAGLLGSETPKGPVRLQFTATSAEVLFPRLFGGG